MPEKNSSPDWFARGAAALGIILSIVGLVLTYHNYRWQRTAYQENLEERILVRLSTSRTITKPELFPFDPRGTVGVEVVNIGMRPLYIKTINLQVERQIFTFYAHIPTKTNQPIKPLEPSEAVNYKMSWDFSEHPLHEQGESDAKEEDIWVRVETTKKTFFQHQTITSESISETVPLKPHASRKPAE